MKCIKCRLADVPQETKGRPKVYCSTVCRRAAEYEIRRIDRRLASLEERWASQRDPSSIVSAMQSASVRKKNKAFVETEIERCEERLRQLLGAERTEGAPSGG